MHFLWIARDGLIYQMIGIGPTEKDPLLKKTALSFRRITEQERRSITAVRLRLVVADGASTLDELTKGAGSTWIEGMTGIVNEMEPIATPAVGTIIKVARRERY